MPEVNHLAGRQSKPQIRLKGCSGSLTGPIPGPTTTAFCRGYPRGVSSDEKGPTQRRVENPFVPANHSGSEALSEAIRAPPSSLRESGVRLPPSVPTERRSER
jgi:hypothetical protein